AGSGGVGGLAVGLGAALDLGDAQQARRGASRGGAHAGLRASRARVDGGRILLGAARILSAGGAVYAAPAGAAAPARGARSGVSAHLGAVWAALDGRVAAGGLLRRARVSSAAMV